MKCLNRQGVVVLSAGKVDADYTTLTLLYKLKFVFVIGAVYRFRQYLDLSVMIRALVDPVNLALLCCPARIETSVPSSRSRPQTKPAT
jgi:hypothetical protein